MKFFRAVVSSVLGVTLMMTLAPLLSTSAGATGAWGNAIEAPGTAVLNVGGSSVPEAQSCSSSGNCAIIGIYVDAASNYQGYVANEINGTWQSAQEIPGLDALNVGGDVGDIMSISCTGNGDCSAGGVYSDSNNDYQAFVVSETSGSWGDAEQVPGFASVNSEGPGSELFSLSCASPGNCSAGGQYADSNGKLQAFVVNQVNGTWGDANEVPGTASLNIGAAAELDNVQCNAVGDCSGAGVYTGSNGDQNIFLVNEMGGTWQPATALSESGLSGATGMYDLGDLSCSSVGNCAVGGDYSVSPTETTAFVADEIGGTWQSAIAIPVDSSTPQASTTVNGISCSSNGQCSATGLLSPASQQSQVFVVSEVGGKWQSAQELSSLSTLNAGNVAIASSISCVLPGDCTMGGFYADGSTNLHAFVVDEVSGAWGSPIDIPGTSLLNTGLSDSATSVVCASDDSCSIVGVYSDSSHHLQSFVDTSAAKFSVPGAAALSVLSSSNGAILVSIHLPSKDGGVPVTSVQYSLNNGAWVTVSLHAASKLRIAGLKAGKTYQVRVRAVNSVGDGTSSVPHPVVVA